MLLVGSTQTINATLYNKLNFHFVRDITPIAGHGLWTRESVAARKAVRAEMGEIKVLLRAQKGSA